MKQNVLLYRLASVLANAKKTEVTPLHICWFDGKLIITAREHTKEKHPVFGNLTPTQRIHGWNTSELDILTRKIRDFLETIT